MTSAKAWNFDTRAYAAAAIYCPEKSALRGLVGQAWEAGLVPYPCEEPSALYERLDEVALAMVQLDMSRIGSQAVLQQIKRQAPTLPVLMVVPQWDISGAVTALRNGANAAITLPFSTHELLHKVQELGVETT